MGALVAGEVVPVAIKQMSEDMRLHLARGQCCVMVGVALVAYSIVGRRDRQAIPEKLRK